MPVSPSSRRAWIEIGLDLQQRQRREVALLAEGVDRNYVAIVEIPATECRPPRGGRG